LPKVAELFVIALSEQDIAKSHDNDVFVFDSSSAILKMERREDEPNSTAHEQRFFRRAPSQRRLLRQWITGSENAQRLLNEDAYVSG